MKFLIWLGIGAILFLLSPSLGVWYVIISALIWSADGVTDSPKKKTNKSSQTEDPSERFSPYNRVYANGEKRVEKISKTGYYYSDGTESWVDITGNEHRANGEIVIENAYIPGRRDIYKNGEYIGYEYEDACGVTRRAK